MARKQTEPAGEKPVDAVERALLRRALGFQQQELFTEELYDKATGEVLETAKRRVVTKEILPDVRALLFWLKNRRPDRWRDRVENADESPEFEFDENDEQL